MAAVGHVVVGLEHADGGVAASFGASAARSSADGVLHVLGVEPDAGAEVCDFAGRRQHQAPELCDVQVGRHQPGMDRRPVDQLAALYVAIR